MTGPGPGKIPVPARVFLQLRASTLEVRGADVYIHVKGYSRAFVTHVDIEHPLMNKVMPPGAMSPVAVSPHPGGFRVRVFKPQGDLPVREIIVIWEGPRLLEDGERSGGIIGGKPGGVYIGFRREILDRLERFAAERGWPPITRTRR